MWSLRLIPVLYSFRRCPYAIRARYLITLVNVRVSIREVVLKSKPDALLRLGGRSTVPQLIDNDGSRYPESLDIIFWALQKSSNNALSQQLWPCDSVLQHKIMAWIQYNDHFFKYWLDRYKYADRYPEQTEEYYRRQGERFLCRIESRLARSEYLMGGAVSLADVCVFPFIRQFVAVDPSWFKGAPYPRLKVWLERFLSSGEFQSTMVKLLPWSEGQQVVYFPF